MNTEDLHKTFDYNPVTGDLIRKKLNKITGTLDYSGYKRTKYKGKTVTCHRIIYTMIHGSIPDHYHIDHIDHDRSNNRIENLQALPPADNVRKKMPRPYNNAVVYKTKAGWIAKITVKHGPFNTESEAHNTVSLYSTV